MRDGVTSASLGAILKFQRLDVRTVRLAFRGYQVNRPYHALPISNDLFLEILSVTRAAHCLGSAREFRSTLISCKSCLSFSGLINLGAGSDKLLGLLFHSNTQRCLLIDLFLRGVYTHVLRDLH